MKTIYFGGGCFWCTEAIFQRVIGVKKVTPGYMGGTIKNPTYKEICSGETGHAEVVEVFYDNKIISFETLLSIFFSTHDPTTLNRQGNDIGTQYRSIVICDDKSEIKAVNLFIENLENEKVFSSKIVTDVSLKKKFYLAETDHLNYYNKNKNQLYCRLVIEPKLKKFMSGFKNKLRKKIN